MPSTVVVGAQWGDEGKGKIVDLLAQQSDVVCRYQGGPNAGHTIVVDGETWKLRQMPSGVVSGTQSVIGAGCVVDAQVFLDEVDLLKERGIDPSIVVLSGNAHLIMPWHVAIDQASERRLGHLQIGTTRRGIGPAYADKASRLGIRVQDVLDPKILRQKIEVALAEKNLWLERIYEAEPFVLEEDVLARVERLADEQRHVADERREALGEAGELRPDLLEVERLRVVDSLEPQVLFGERDLDLLPQDLRIEHVLHTDPDARRLVGVRRADAAARRADLQVAEPPLARAVERDVPRHDQVRVAGDEDQPVRAVTARLEVVELLDQHGGIDDASRADRARNSRDDARRDCPDLVRLAADDDRVPGVRPALVAAHHIRALREQVDDLSLALVAPLRPDDDGRWHAPESA